MFKDLLNKIKGFKYQITLAVLLSKIKSYENVEYSPVYFNSTTKTVINNKFNIDNYFKKSFTELIIGLVKEVDRLLKKYAINI